MTRSLVPVAIAVLLAAPGAASAQSPASPMQEPIRSVFNILKGNLSKTAEKVLEADSHFGICAAAAGEKPPQSGIEEALST
jgi:hypothetical protein